MSVSPARRGLHLAGLAGGMCAAVLMASPALAAVAEPTAEPSVVATPTTEPSPSPTPSTSPAATAAPSPTATTATPTTNAIATAAPRKLSKRERLAKRVIKRAWRFTGRPYVFGASGPRAFDCSGYTQFVYKAVGVHLPHSAAAQSRMGRPVSKRNAKPGDLIFFHSGGSVYHVAIYAGNGKMYDAPTYGQKSAKRKIWSNSYFVRRVLK